MSRGRPRTVAITPGAGSAGPEELSHTSLQLICPAGVTDDVCSYFVPLVPDWNGCSYSVRRVPQQRRLQLLCPTGSVEVTLSHRSALQEVLREARKIVEVEGRKRAVSNCAVLKRGSV